MFKTFTKYWLVVVLVSCIVGADRNATQEFEQEAHRLVGPNETLRCQLEVRTCELCPYFLGHGHFDIVGLPQSRTTATAAPNIAITVEFCL